MPLVACSAFGSRSPSAGVSWCGRRAGAIMKGGVSGYTLGSSLLGFPRSSAKGSERAGGQSWLRGTHHSVSSQKLCPSPNQELQQSDAASAFNATASPQLPAAPTGLKPRSPPTLPSLSKGMWRGRPHCHVASGSHQAWAPAAEGRHTLDREDSEHLWGHILPPAACAFKKPTSTTSSLLLSACGIPGTGCSSSH